MTWGMAVIDDQVGEARCFYCGDKAEFQLGGHLTCSSCAGKAARSFLERREQYCEKIKKRSRR